MLVASRRVFLTTTAPSADDDELQIRPFAGPLETTEEALMLVYDRGGTRTISRRVKMPARGSQGQQPIGLASDPVNGDIKSEWRAPSGASNRRWGSQSNLGSKGS